MLPISVMLLLLRTSAWAARPVMLPGRFPNVLFAFGVFCSDEESGFKAEKSPPLAAAGRAGLRVSVLRYCFELPKDVLCGKESLCCS